MSFCEIIITRETSGNAVVFLQGRAFIIAGPLPCPVRLIDLFRKILIVKPGEYHQSIPKLHTSSSFMIFSIHAWRVVSDLVIDF